MMFDDRLREILLPAARAGLAVLERHVATRERKGTLHRTNAVTSTNNIAALCVPNFTNRAGEPQAHVHAGIANLTLDELDVEWTAIETSWLFKYESRLLLEATCHNELALHLRALGYPIVRTDRSFEIDGIAEEILAKISTRRTEVLETAALIREEREFLKSLETRSDRQQSRLMRLQWLNDRDIRDLAARESRSAKTEPSFEEVVHDLQRRLTAAELDTIAHVVDRARNRRREPVHSTLSVGTAAARILRRQFVMTCTGLKAQVLTENPGMVRSTPDGLPWSAGDFINLRDGFVAERQAWDRISTAIDTLIASRGTSPALRATITESTSPQAGWVSKILAARSQWMLLDEGLFAPKDVIEALKNVGISAASALGGAAGNHVVVLSSAELLAVFTNDAAVLSRILIVRDVLRSSSVEALLCRKLIENGAVTAISAAEPEPTFAATTESTFLDEAATILLNARTRRGRFAQFLAGSPEEVAAFTAKVRTEIQGEANIDISAGDTVRATGNNRIGAKRTYRSWLYAICALREDGSLMATNGLNFPPSFTHLEFGFAVSGPELVAPNSDTVVVSPTVSGAALKKLQTARPELRIVQMVFRNRPRSRRRRACRRHWQPHLNLWIEQALSRGPDRSVTVEPTVIKHPVEQLFPAHEDILL